MTLATHTLYQVPALVLQFPKMVQGSSADVCASTAATPEPHRLHTVKVPKHYYALIEVGDLRTRRGAAVSVNVRPQDATEVGEIEFILHPRVKKAQTQLQFDASSDELIVKELLGKVRQREPLAAMEWDADAKSWYIYLARA